MILYRLFFVFFKESNYELDVLVLIWEVHIQETFESTEPLKAFGVSVVPLFLTSYTSPKTDECLFEYLKKKQCELQRPNNDLH